MAKELRHKDAGTQLTRTEDNAVDRHYIVGQAADDVVYASSASQLSGLAVAASRILGKKASGGLAALTGAEALALMTTSLKAELDLLDLAGLTAGELLVATSATAAAWQSSGVVLTAPTLNGTTALGSTPIFDAGSGWAQITTTGDGLGLKVITSYTGSHGATLKLYHNSASPADNDVVGYLTYSGNTYASNGNPADTEITMGVMQCKVTDATDESEDATFDWYLRNGGSLNFAMTLSGAGGLNVDANLSVTYGDDDHPVGVTVADAYDDAMVLKQGVSQGQMEVLEGVGVMSRKDTGSGWMMDVTRFSYLLAGGIYQNRAKIDNLEERLNRLEGGNGSTNKRGSLGT